VSTLTTEVLASAVRQGFQIGKEEVELPLFADDMILYRKPKRLPRVLLELIDDFSNVTAYNINIQKSLGFLYTSDATE